MGTDSARSFFRSDIKILHNEDLDGFIKANPDILSLKVLYRDAKDQADLLLEYNNKVDSLDDNDKGLTEKVKAERDVFLAHLDKLNKKTDIRFFCERISHNMWINLHYNLASNGDTIPPNQKPRLVLEVCVKAVHGITESQLKGLPTNMLISLSDFIINKSGSEWNGEIVSFEIEEEGLKKK